MSLRALPARLLALGALLLAMLPAVAQWGREPRPDEALRFSRASLVFATHDLSSPVSLFGHTFLVLHDGDEPEPESLVIEFGGIVERPADHVGALLDHIPGRFSASYLSYKEREYFAAGRSLWVYPLRLDDSSMGALRQQALAVVGKERPYTFLRSNCSHHILALVGQAAGLDLAEPEWPFVVPVDTLRRLIDAGLLAPPQYRAAPSVRARAAVAALSGAARDRFDAFLRDPDQPLIGAEDPALGQALSAGAEHWILVDAQARRRDAWYRLKRRFPSSADPGAPQTDPLDTGAHSTWTWVQGLDGADSTLGWSHGFVDFRTEDLTELRNAKLQLLQLQVSRHDGRLRLDRMDLLSMESNLAGDLFSPGFTQRLDIGYMNDSVAAGRRSETLLLRFGRGLTRGVGGVDASILPVVAVGAVQGGGGWRPAASAGLRVVLYAPLPAGWRTRARLEWHGRALAGRRSTARLELAAPTLRSGHAFGLQAELHPGSRNRASLGLRWSYRPRPAP